MITIILVFLLLFIFKQPGIDGISNDALLIFSGIFVLSLANEWKNND